MKRIEDIPLDDNLQGKYYRSLIVRRVALVVFILSSVAFMLFVFGYSTTTLQSFIASLLYSASLLFYVYSEFVTRQLHYLFSMYLDIKIFESLENKSEDN